MAASPYLRAREIQNTCLPVPGRYLYYLGVYVFSIACGGNAVSTIFVCGLAADYRWADHVCVLSAYP